MYEPTTYLIIILTFILAGTVNGVIELGFPSISLGILAAVIDLHLAIALLLIPVFVTHVKQAVIGGYTLAILARLWPFMLTALPMIWVGAALSETMDGALLVGLLGILLIADAIIGLRRRQRPIPRPRQPWVGPLFGALNGILAGMTGSLAIPGVMYLQAIRLPRNMVAQAMSMLFTVSTMGFAVILREQRVLTIEMALISAVAALPAIIGMKLGQRLRRRLSVQPVRRVFFTVLLLLGLYLLIQSRS